MKKLFLLAGAFVLSFSLQGQMQTPAPSPFSKIEQKVGLTDVTVEYSRPSMKGRTIFGELVPYDQLWRTGANARTKITFSDDIKFGGTDVKAGSYGLLTKPGISSWDVILYEEANGGGLPGEWDDAKVAAKVSAQVNALPWDVETFTIVIGELSNTGASLGFFWEKSSVMVPFEVPTDALATKSIEAVMAGPTGGDYFSAASYYLETGKDLEKAKEWIDKAVEMNENAFWMMRVQSLIYAKTGDTKGAIEAAKRSLEVAKKAGNDDYVRMNTASLKEWGAM
ncbi:MAG: DUF2911 domain-containing protein [Flavobacteriaceae bacterium]|nr:DUF2911 domain-containing protein [Flavobacteriaceae bacterium]